MPERRILVVDDEENLRTMLVAALRYEGYDVIQSADGAEGLKAVREHRPDLVVLDVMMPHVDGFQMCRRMRESGDRTPVIFLTARDSSTDKVEGLGIGGDDYLDKPFNLDELVARVEAVSRRFEHAPSASATYTVADLVLDDISHRVTRAGEEIQALAHRVPPPAAPHAQRGQGPLARPTPRGRLGLFARRRPLGGGDVHRVRAPQGRRDRAQA
ncbi:hypothetical protein GCM10025876_21020 [Demequina litorisediminis]|uniref:Response regulatory domain-containing protein n=1 Tax=Demequina litorisediminis TaxID=1849022 RepID=A0ABQ6IGP0_9MICO|nr:hypothetical protein GCM10025876_21020 [Demequina litorisediminis]